MNGRILIILIASAAALSAAYYCVVIMPTRAMQALDSEQQETLDRLAELKRAAKGRPPHQPNESPTPVVTSYPIPRATPAPAPAVIVPPAVVDAIKRLKSPDAKTRIGAASWLAQNPSQAALEPLIAALPDSDPYVQLWSAKALGSIKPVSPKAIDAVLHMKKQSGYGDGPEEALRDMGAEATMPALLKAIAGRESVSRERALRMLVGFGGAMSSQNKLSAGAVLKSVIAQDSGELQWLAAIGLAAIDPTAHESLPVLARGMADESKHRRKHSVLALQRLGEAGAAAMKTAPRLPSTDTPEGVLWHLDQAGSGDEIMAALGHLKKLGPEAAPMMRRYAADASKDGRKRMLALDSALRPLAPERRHDELIAALNADTDDEFRTTCVNRIARNKDPRAEAVLKEVLADPKMSNYMKMVAGEMLAGMGDDSGKERAIQSVLAGDSYHAIAARTLASLGARDVLPKLKEASADNPKNVDLLTAAIKIDLAGRDKAEQVKILKRLMKEPDEKPHLLYKWIALELRTIRTPDAIRALDELGRSKNEHVSWYSRLFLQDAMLTGSMSVAEVKSAIGATPLVKSVEEILRMKKEKGFGKNQ